MGSKNKKFSPNKEDTKRIIDSFISGEKTVKEIAEEFGFGCTAIRSFLKRNRVEMFPSKERSKLHIRKKNQKYVYDVEFIDFLNSKGYCLAHISQVLGIPYNNLSAFYTNRRIKRNKVPDDVTPFQMQMVIDKYTKGSTVAEAIEGLDINYKTATYWLLKNGVVMRNASWYERKKKVSTYSDTADLLVEKYLEGYSTLDVSKLTKVSDKRVREIISERNIKRTKSDSCNAGIGVTYNLSAFSDFEGNENDAYFYGYLLADGCITSGNKRMLLTVKDTDSDIVYKLSNHVCGGKNVTFSEVKDKRTDKIYKRCQFGFYKKEIVDRIIAQNYEPNKSTKERLPNFDWLNNRHFWRGLIDGDGWVCADKSYTGLIGSDEVVNGYLLFIETNIGLITPRKVVKVNGKNLSYYRINITGQDARNIIRYLYSDATVYLNRKYEQYLKLENKG